MSQKVKAVKHDHHVVDAIGPIKYNTGLENNAVEVVGNVMAFGIAVIIVKVFVISLVKSVLIVAGLIVVTLIVLYCIHQPRAFKTVRSFTLVAGSVTVAFIFLGSFGGK